MEKHPAWALVMLEFPVVVAAIRFRFRGGYIPAGGCVETTVSPAEAEN